MTDEGAGEYCGIFAAMPTPLTVERAIDRRATRQVVDYLLARGLAGVSILGSTGECAGLTRRQRREFAETVAEAVAGRAVVFAGAAGTAVDDIADEVESLGALGLAAVLVPPPFYFQLDTRAVIAFYERLAERSPVPILLYNIPQATKVPIALEAIAQLAAHPNIAGMKDSAGNLGYFTEAARIGKERSDFVVFTGADTMLAPALLMGGRGLIGAGANVAPEVFVQLGRSFVQGDYAGLVTLQQQANKAMAASGVGAYPANFKAVLALRGLCQATMTYPLRELSGDEMAELRARLIAAGVSADSATARVVRRE